MDTKSVEKFLKEGVKVFKSIDSGYCMKTIACHSCPSNRNLCKFHIDNQDFIIGVIDRENLRNSIKGDNITELKNGEVTMIYSEGKFILYECDRQHPLYIFK